MTLETRADFARRLGVNRSTITRWVDTGRVVLSGALIDVDFKRDLSAIHRML